MLLSQPLLELLIGRGITNVDEYLHQPTSSDFANPFFLPHLEEAVSRVLTAVREGARISVFGDYDADGVLASHVLVSVLRRLGACVRIYLPHRDEGYGLSTLKAGLIMQRKGPHSGAKLNVPLKQIRLGDVFEATSGDWIPVDDKALTGLMKKARADADEMEAFEVSKDVGNVKNNSPELLTGVN